MNLNGCNALITGASAGIGREFARQLAGRASSIVLMARRQDRLETLQDELGKHHPDLNVRIRKMDLSDDEQVEALCQWIEHERIEIDLLINNAGLGDLGAFATSEPERVRQMLLVNITALTLLTRRLLPAMIARKRGTILNVSSSAGFLPIAGFAVYAATKAYVTSFSEAIRAELRGSGVSVTTLCPGPVHTEFTEVAKRSSDDPEKLGPEFTHVSVENVVRAALNAVERERPHVIPGFAMKLGMALVRLTPMPILRLASRFSAKRNC
jgi:short-subunit dehydrogenase